MAILAGLHRRWRAAVILPFAYMIAGLLVSRYYFEAHKDGSGILPLGDATKLVLVFIGGAVITTIFYLRQAMGRVQRMRLAEVAGSPDSFNARAKDSQMIQLALCDLASLPGIVIFVLDNDLAMLAIFSITSMAFYLGAMPSGRRLGEVFFLSRS